MKRKRRESQAFLSARWGPILIGLVFFVGGCSTTLSSFQNNLSLNPSTLMGDEPSSENSSDSLLEFERQALKHLLLGFNGHHTPIDSKLLSTLEQTPNLSVHDSLVEMLKDKYWFTRLQAASRIELVHDDRGLEALQTLLHDPDIVVKLRVERILANWKSSISKNTNQMIEGESVKGISSEIASDPRMIIERAEVFFLKTLYPLAVREYQRFLNAFPEHFLGPFAQYKLGESYFNMAISVDRDPTPVQNSLAAFQTFLKSYPESHYKSKVRAKILQCQDWLAQVDFLVGRFYYQRESYLAAAHRFEKIVADDLDLEVLPDALYNLAQAYMGIGQEKWPHARNVLINLTQKFPNYQYRQESEQLLAQLNEALPADKIGQELFVSLNPSTKDKVPETSSLFPKQYSSSIRSPNGHSIIFTQAIQSNVSSQDGRNPSAHSQHANQPNCLALASTHSFPGTGGIPSQLDCKFEVLQEDLLQLKLSYDQQQWSPSYVGNFNELLQNMDRENNLVRSSGTMDFLDKELKAQFELAYSYPTSQERVQPDPGVKKGMATKIGFNGKHDTLKYWGQYQYLGKEFTKKWNSKPEDKEETKLGAEYTWGLFKPKVELKRFNSNVDDNSDESQTIINGSKTSLAFVAPQWPIFTLAYGHDRKEVMDRPNGALQNSTFTDMLSADLWYQYSSLQTYLVTSHSLIRDQMDSGSDMDVNYYLLGGSWGSYEEGLTVSPNLSFMQMYDRLNGNRTDTMTASLGLDYTDLERFLKISFYGSSLTTKDSEKYVDNHSIGFSLRIEKDLQKILNFPHYKPTILLTLGHYGYSDFIYSDPNSSISSALLLFKVTP